MNVPPQYCIFSNLDSNSNSNLGSNIVKIKNNRTYNDYLKNDVIKRLELELIKSNYEMAIYWSTELHISGYVDDIIKVMMKVIFKYIENDSIIIWFYLRLKKYYKILDQYDKIFKFESRNNQEIRNIIADMISTIALHYKQEIIKYKIIDSDFSEELLLKNCSENYAVIDEKLGFNELMKNLSMGKYNKCVYWIYWIKKFVSKQKNNSIPYNTNYITNLINSIEYLDYYSYFKYFMEKVKLSNSLKELLVIRCIYTLRDEKDSILEKYWISINMVANINNIYIQIINDKDKEYLESISKKKLNETYEDKNNEIEKRMMKNNKKQEKINKKHMDQENANIKKVNVNNKMKMFKNIIVYHDE